MSNDKTKDLATETKAMTVAQAAKAVRRPVTEMVDGKDEAGKAIMVPRIKRVAVDTDDVPTFRDYGNHVVVVTKEGQKFTSAEE